MNSRLIQSVFALTLSSAIGLSFGAAATSTAPTTEAATQSAIHYPTPTELVAKMKAMQAKADAASKVAYFDLSGGVAEKPQGFSLFAERGGDTLQSLLDRLHQARTDSEIKAVLINLGQGHIGLADAQELRDALAAVGKAGKRAFVYADGYDTDSYTLASGATDICMLSGGEIMVPGVGLSTMFYKGLFDKLGVQADYVQIGDYKGAKEPYTNTAPSEQLKGELTRLTDNLYDQVVTGISTYRKLPATAVTELIDDTIETGDLAKEKGLVDHLVDQDGLRPLITTELKNEIELIDDYGEKDRKQLDLSSPFALFSLLSQKPAEASGPAVALIYASGVISDGEDQSSLFSGDGIASQPMRRALHAAARDDSVKAVVIRINSPGGSALASEVMWQAARRVAAKKPLIISVGGMAASGGYYLASAGDRIFADPGGIVGSIGVVGGKFVLKDLYGKLGLTTGDFSKGRNADLFSSDTPFTPEQRTLVTRWMHQTYEQFEHRVLTTRSPKIKDIEQVAQGRIFLAPQALSVGLVDQIGGIEDALQCAATNAGLDPAHFSVRVLPAPRTLADLISGGGGNDAATPIRPTFSISPDSVLRGLAPAQVGEVENALQMLRLLQSRPVVLMSPINLTIR